MKFGIRIFGIVLVVAIFMLRAHAQPRLEWLQTYGDSTGAPYVLCLAEADEGGFFLGGLWNRGQGGWHTVIKTDAEGRIEWDSEIENQLPNVAESILALPGNQVVASGSIVSQGSYWVTSYDENGQILWTIFDRNSSSYCDLLRTPDGDILSVSSKRREPPHNDDEDIRLMWITPQGEQYKIRDYYFPEFSGPIKLFETENGYEIVLFRRRVGDSAAFFRISNDGDSLDIVEFEVETNYLDNLVRLSNGTYVLPRNLYVDEIFDDMAMLTYYGNDGDSLFCRTYRMSSRDVSNCYFAGVLPEIDGSLTLYGSYSIRDNDRDVFLMRINQEGDSLWTTYFDTTQSGAYNAILAKDGGYVITGSVWDSGPSELLKTTNDTLSAPSTFPISLSSFTLHPAFPNPFNSSTTITYDVAQPGFVRLGVYDAVGRLVGKVKEGYAQPGNYREVWNGAGVASGNYLIRIEAGNDRISKSFELIR